MKQTFTSRILLAVVAVALFCASSFATPRFMLKATDGGRDIPITPSKTGSFSLPNVPAGSYEIRLVGTSAELASMSAAKKTVDLDVAFSQLQSGQKTAIVTSRSNIKHQTGMAPGGTGTGADSTTLISTSKSNIRHNNVAIGAGTHDTSSNEYYSVIASGIVLVDDSSASGTIKIITPLNGGR